MQDVENNLIEALYLVELEMDKHQDALRVLKERTKELDKLYDAETAKERTDETKPRDKHNLAEQINKMIDDCEKFQITERVSCMIPFGKRHLKLSVKIAADDKNGGRIKITEIV